MDAAGGGVGADIIDALGLGAWEDSDQEGSDEGRVPSPPPPAETTAEAAARRDREGQEFAELALRAVEAATCDVKSRDAWGTIINMVGCLYRPGAEMSPGVDRGLAAAAAAHVSSLRGGALLRAAHAALSAPPYSAAAPTAGSLDLVTKQFRILQCLCVLYSTVDPVECAGADEGACCGSPEDAEHDATAAPGGGAAAAAASAAAAALHAAAPALAAVACPLLRRSLEASARCPESHRDAHADVQQYALRLLRHVASLEARPGGPPAPVLDAAAFSAAVGAVLTAGAPPPPAPTHAAPHPLLRQLALSALWAFLDAEPAAADALAAAPGLLPKLRELLAPLPPRARRSSRKRRRAASPDGAASDSDGDEAPPCADDAAAAYEEEEEEDELDPWGLSARAVAEELQAGAAGALWGCSSRVSPSAVTALAEVGVADATAALLVRGAASAAARFCAASALAGWAAAAAPAPPRLLAAAWGAPRVRAGVTSLLTRGLAALDAGGPEREEVYDTMNYDWKLRDLTEATSALCRLLSVSAWHGGSAGLEDENDTPLPARDLAAGVAAWPLCVMSAPGAGVLSAARVAHLAADARLAPALAALAAGPPGAPAAVARRTLAHLAAASPAAAAAVVAALCGPARDLAAGAPADVALRCEPGGETLPACRALLAARSPFFAALLAARPACFSEGAAVAAADAAARRHSAGSDAFSSPPPPLLTLTLRDVHTGGVRAFLRWAATGGAAAASLEDALSCLRVAQRVLAAPLAAAMADAAVVTAPAAPPEQLAAALRFAFGTDGPHSTRIATAAVAAAVAGDHGPALLAAEAGDELAVPPGARDALIAQLVATQRHGSAAPAAARSAAAAEPAQRTAHGAKRARTSR